MFQIYLKTRLNCLLMRNSVCDVSTPEAPKPVESKEVPMLLDEEEEGIWDSMAVVKDKTRKKMMSEIVQNKNKKQKIEVCIMYHFTSNSFVFFQNIFRVHE